MGMFGGFKQPQPSQPMFGAGYDPTSGGMSLNGWNPSAAPTPAPQAPAPSFFGEGGVGRNIAGNIGDYLAKLGGGSAIYAPIQQERAQLDRQMAAQAAQQQAEYQRQLALAQWKRQNPEPGSVETNYNFIAGKDPKQASAYLANVADPVVPFLNPATGLYDNAHKSGAPVSAPEKAAIPSGTKMTINGKDAWYVNGDWYDNPEGR